MLSSGTCDPVSQCEKEFGTVEGEHSWAREGRRVNGYLLGPVVEALRAAGAERGSEVLAAARTSRHGGQIAPGSPGVKDGAPPSPRCRRRTRIASSGHGGVAGAAGVAAGLRVPRAPAGSRLADPAPAARRPAGEGGDSRVPPWCPSVSRPAWAVSDARRPQPAPSLRLQRGSVGWLGQTD